jgi:excinuclease ABC subunit C
MGEAAVASCVVYDRNDHQRGEYRRYNLRDVAPGDDYAAMRQALGRRYARLTAEEGRIPDLVLVDGGRGQLNAARAALADLGVADLPLVGVAKGPERRAGLETLVLATGERELVLPPDHPGLHLVQAIRDEAHRFAIAGHRGRRSRSRTRSTLSEIPGVGDKRRQRLLAHFGGLQGVQAAAVEDLAQVPGVSRALAEAIYRHLHA